MPVSCSVDREDIAHAVIFLASDDAGQVTGQQITVDGGLGIRQQF